MTNLAIRGHINHGRGREVIKTLEMLGGVNQFNLDGNTDAWYVLTDTGVIRWSEWLFEEKGFTLEEFFEKYPYKVGDRVRVPEYESEVCISKMYWDGNEVQYEVVTDEVEWYSAKELNEFNEPNSNEEKKINQMSLANCDLDEVEIVLGDKFELKIREGKYYAVKKKLYYPKTYEECCEVLNLGEDGHLYTKGHQASLIQDFHKLFICRAAYWKIAGEQMGLRKPWEPDWSTEHERKYVIEVYRNKVRTNSQGYSNTILAFPTAEMRDAFLENFGYLIELCKELL